MTGDGGIIRVDTILSSMLGRKEGQQQQQQMRTMPVTLQTLSVLNTCGLQQALASAQLKAVPCGCC